MCFFCIGRPKNRQNFALLLSFYNTTPSFDFFIFYTILKKQNKEEVETVSERWKKKCLWTGHGVVLRAKGSQTGANSAGESASPSVDLSLGHQIVAERRPARTVAQNREPSRWENWALRPRPSVAVWSKGELPSLEFLFYVPGLFSHNPHTASTRPSKKKLFISLTAPIICLIISTGGRNRKKLNMDSPRTRRVECVCMCVCVWWWWGYRDIQNTSERWHHRSLEGWWIRLSCFFWQTCR